MQHLKQIKAHVGLIKVCPHLLIPVGQVPPLLTFKVASNYEYECNWLLHTITHQWLTPNRRHWRDVLNLKEALRGTSALEQSRASRAAASVGTGESRAKQLWGRESWEWKPRWPSPTKIGKQGGSADGTRHFALVGLPCAPSGRQWREAASQQVPVPKFPSDVLVQLGLGVLSKSSERWPFCPYQGEGKWCAYLLGRRVFIESLQIMVSRAQ